MSNQEGGVLKFIGTLYPRILSYQRENKETFRDTVWNFAVFFLAMLFFVFSWVVTGATVLYVAFRENFLSS